MCKGRGLVLQRSGRQGLRGWVVFRSLVLPAQRQATPCFTLAGQASGTETAGQEIIT